MFMQTVVDIYTTFPLIIMLYYTSIQRFDLLFFMLGADHITSTIKYFSNLLPKNSYLYKLTRRPVPGALCDYFSMIPCDKNSPGFPSGHMATTTFFYISLLLLKHDNLSLAWKHNRFLCHISIIGIMFMGFTRYIKGCHTILQIVSGSTIGYISSLTWKFIF